MYSLPGIPTYYGGKGAEGVYQSIINQIPPHTRYIEPFLGAGYVMRAKRPALENIGIDKNEAIIKVWQSLELRYHTFRCADAISFLLSLEDLSANDFIFIDPPYPIFTRLDQRKTYLHELTDLDHYDLCKTICRVPANVAITTYDNHIYQTELKGWRTIQFRSKTRGGVSIQTMYMNYPEPTELHDYSYLGRDYRERERIAKKVRRWADRLDTLPVLERNAILVSITTGKIGAGQHQQN